MQISILLDEILQLCTSQAINGEIILQNNGEECRLILERGEITKVDYKNFSEDEALDTVRQWNDGTFVLRSRTLNFASKQADTSKKKTKHLFSDAIEIGNNSWWVGRHNPESMLQLNVYLRQFINHKRCINFLINPGSPFDYQVISKKIASIIDDISNIHIYSINHGCS